MSRVFWMAVGAVGGVMAYRKGTQAVARARELGPLGTAQVAAQATSSLAGRTANGLGRLKDLQARRQGRLVVGSAQEVSAPAAAQHPVPADWVPGHDPATGRRRSERATSRTRRPRPGAAPTAPVPPTRTGTGGVGTPTSPGTASVPAQGEGA